VNRDPIGYDGSPWNLYEYVGSQPTYWEDPSGLITWKEFWRNYSHYDDFGNSAPADPAWLNHGNEVCFAVSLVAGSVAVTKQCLKQCVKKKAKEKLKEQLRKRNEKIWEQQLLRRRGGPPYN